MSFDVLYFQLVTLVILYLTMFLSCFRLIEEFLERLGGLKPKVKGGRSFSRHRSLPSVFSGYTKENL